MKLTDFLHFAPFNRLREQMGTRRLGYFELFDPRYHLTGDERVGLAREGLVLAPGQLQRLVDRTFAYKNSRVLCYPEQSSGAQLQLSPPVYHVTDCADLVEKLRPSGKGTPHLRVTTSGSGVFPLRVDGEVELRQFQVCEICLQQLGFEGFDAQRNRRRAWSLQLLEAFTPERFFARYRQYPVKPEEYGSRLTRGEEPAGDLTEETCEGGRVDRWWQAPTK
ncbi:hypothetical protein [Aestuariirhabdus sp. LZHN29]|uniref:hypothetical protein n=1 Tax=Aestuariirhabdus sp. LZHN29 TaxID=3417462 RepID=UPI003CEE7F13